MLHDEKAVLHEAGITAITEFLETQNNYSVLRYSGKVVVFDTRIPIQLAFYALVEHDMQAAPLWDNAKRQFVGLLTVTDFIDLLRSFYSSSSSSGSGTSNGEDVKDSLASLSIAAALNDARSSCMVKHHHRKFMSVDADATLYQSCALLHRHGLDFLPVVAVSDNDVRMLATVTYTNILEHLVTHFREQRRLFDDSIYELGIGTYSNIATVTLGTTLEECLSICQSRDLNALPVVDEQGRVINVYSRSDISFLHHATDANDAVRSLEKTVGEILQAASRTTSTMANVSTPDRLHTCSPTHTLQSIFEYFAQLKFNRLIVVDDEQRVIGVVSARDLVAYFVGKE